MSDVILSVRDLHVAFGEKRKKFEAVRGVSFDVYAGETFGLVGESGSGKTTIGRAIIRVYPTSGGEIVYKGEKINGRIKKDLDKRVTREVQMIFQDPMASLNERAKVDYIVSEGLYNIGEKLTKEERKQRVEQALIMQPDFIIADEPISALDVSIRAQVLNLMSQLQKERGLTYLFISHDLSVMRFICDRIAVIHKGLLVELAETETLFRHPLHPYTRALLSAVPMPNPAYEKKKVPLVYDESVHDYSVDGPKWVEIEPGHFVFGNDKELSEYARMCENT